MGTVQTRTDRARLLARSALNRDLNTPHESAMAQAGDANEAATAERAELPLPKILLRRPGKLELFKGPSKADGDTLKDLCFEEGFPEVDASSTEWSK